MPQRHLRADELLCHGAFVRRLAHSLVRDPHVGDDAAQETWLAAVRTPPPSDHPARPWLATVVRNAVRRRHRGETRRRAREEAAARPEQTPPTVDRVARREILQRVVTAVLGLEEPYQTTVLMRYYDDLPPRVIADRMRVPVETVKSRLKRGTARVRARLDDGCPGGRTEWLAALVPFAGLQAGSTVTAAAGAYAIMSKLKILGLVLVLLLGGYLAVVLLGDEGDAPEPGPRELAALPSDDTPPPPVGEPRTGLDVRGRPAPQALRADRAQRAAAAAPKKAPKKKDVPRNELSKEQIAELATETARNVVEGVVVRGKEPVRGGNLRVWHGGDTAVRASQDPALTQRLQDDGTFRIEGLKDGRHLLEVELAGGAKRLVSLYLDPKRKSNRRVVVLLGSASFEGHLYDADGRPLGRKTVQVSGTTAGTSITLEATTAPDGSWSVSGVPAGAFWIAAVPPNTSPKKIVYWMKQRVVAEGATEVVVLGRDPRVATWHGHVTGSRGRAILGGGFIQLVKDAGEDGPAKVITLDYDGRGRIRAAVPRGTYTVVLGPPGHQRERIVAKKPLVIRSADVHQDIVLRGARVTGLVTMGASGKVISSTSQRIYFKRKGDKSNRKQAVFLNEDGTYRIDGLKPGSYVVSGYPLQLKDARGDPMRFEIPSEATRLDVDLQAVYEPKTK